MGVGQTQLVNQLIPTIDWEYIVTSPILDELILSRYIAESIATDAGPMYILPTLADVNCGQSADGEHHSHNHLSTL